MSATYCQWGRRRRLVTVILNQPGAAFNHAAMASIRPSGRQILPPTSASPSPAAHGGGLLLSLRGGETRRKRSVASPRAGSVRLAKPSLAIKVSSRGRGQRGPRMIGPSKVRCSPARLPRWATRNVVSEAVSRTESGAAATHTSPFQRLSTTVSFSSCHVTRTSDCAVGCNQRRAPGVPTMGVPAIRGILDPSSILRNAPCERAGSRHIGSSTKSVRDLHRRPQPVGAVG